MGIFAPVRGKIRNASKMKLLTKNYITIGFKKERRN